MEQNIFTTRVKQYRDRREGDLVYQVGTTSIERTDGRIIIKVTTMKEENWLQLSDFITCAAIMVNNWAYDKMTQEDINDFKDLPPLERDANYEQMRDDDFKLGEDPEIGSVFTFNYFYDVQNWVMYENDAQYLFLYEMEIKEVYRNDIKSQMDALAYWLPNDLAPLTDFLESWYYRVNGMKQGSLH